MGLIRKLDLTSDGASSIMRPSNGTRSRRWTAADVGHWVEYCNKLHWRQEMVPQVDPVSCRSGDLGFPGHFLRLGAPKPVGSVGRRGWTACGLRRTSILDHVLPSSSRVFLDLHATICTCERLQEHNSILKDFISRRQAMVSSSGSWNRCRIAGPSDTSWAAPFVSLEPAWKPSKGHKRPEYAGSSLQGSVCEISSPGALDLLQSAVGEIKLCYTRPFAAIVCERGNHLGVISSI